MNPADVGPADLNNALNRPKRKFKLKDIKDNMMVDSISVKDGIITVRDEFFYRHGKSSQDLVRKVKSMFPNAEILDHGENWAAFRGSASVANSSHWYVKFRVSQ